MTKAAAPTVKSAEQFLDAVFQWKLRSDILDLLPREPKQRRDDLRQKNLNLAGTIRQHGKPLAAWLQDNGYDPDGVRRIVHYASGGGTPDDAYKELTDVTVQLQRIMHASLAVPGDEANERTADVSADDQPPERPRRKGGRKPAFPGLLELADAMRAETPDIDLQVICNRYRQHYSRSVTKNEKGEPEPTVTQLLERERYVRKRANGKKAK